MKTAFYFCTKSKEAEETFAFKSLSRIKNSTSWKFDIFYDTNNKIGLSEKYNNTLKLHAGQFDNIVFIHDDVYIDDLGVVSKLENAHQTFDIVGIAGGINPVIKQPALWHLMCGGFHGGNLRGAVAHKVNKDQIGMTNFGPTPSRVAIIDGLFISVKTECYLNKDWKFNENYRFHHYDIASCIDANNKKLKIGVVPIWVVHSSPGLLSFEDINFVNSQEKFLEEYSNIDSV